MKTGSVEMELMEDTRASPANEDVSIPEEKTPW